MLIASTAFLVMFAAMFGTNGHDVADTEVLGTSIFRGITTSTAAVSDVVEYAGRPVAVTIVDGPSWMAVLGIVLTGVAAVAACVPLLRR